MAEIQKSEVVSFKLGDRVKIRDYVGEIGRITEMRGPLGPGGAAVYRVLVGRKPTVSYIELLGDQLEIVPAAEPADRATRPGKSPKDG